MRVGGKLTIRDEDGRSKGRLIEKYDACTDDNLKTAILRSFVVPNGVVRVVVATCAFGMGIDCPNIYQVFHWGSPSTLAMYVQEVGRCGRDGHHAVATLFRARNMRNVDEDMVAYCREKDCCRRKMLMAPFTEGRLVAKPSSTFCSCCDICEKLCPCSSCVDGRRGPPPGPLPPEHGVPVAVARPRLTGTEIRNLRQRILLHRVDQFRISHQSSTPVGASLTASTVELLTALTDGMIETVVDNHNTIYSSLDIQHLCPSLASRDACALVDIIDTFYQD